MSLPAILLKPKPALQLFTATVWFDSESPTPDGQVLKQEGLAQQITIVAMSLEEAIETATSKETLDKLLINYPGQTYTRT